MKLYWYGIYILVWYTGLGQTGLIPQLKVIHLIGALSCHQVAEISPELSTAWNIPTQSKQRNLWVWAKRRTAAERQPLLALCAEGFTCYNMWSSCLVTC